MVSDAWSFGRSFSFLQKTMVKNEPSSRFGLTNMFTLSIIEHLPCSTIILPLVVIREVCVCLSYLAKTVSQLDCH